MKKPGLGKPDSSDPDIMDSGNTSKKIDLLSLGILNSVSAHIAVIDSDGKVIAVNDAWTQFAVENGGEPAALNIGANYFHACRNAVSGSENKAANDALDGIHKVFAQEISEFELEYDCHSSEQERWFLMRVTPLYFLGQKAVISHIDISKKKRLQYELIQREKELSALNMISRKVSSSISLGHVTAAILDQISSILDPDRSMLFLRKGDTLHLIDMENKNIDDRMDVNHVHRVGECLCGLSVSTGNSIFSLDIHQDKRCTWSECKEAGITSFASIPLKYNNEIIGTLGIASLRKRDFKRQKDFLESIANDISIYLENSLLYEKTIQHAGELKTELAERKRTQDALVKSEQKYKSLIKNIPGMVYRGFADWSVDYVSGLKRISGYTVEELNGKEKKWLNIIHPDDLEGVLKKSEKIKYQTKDLVQTYRIITKQGEVRWLVDRKTSCFSPDGNFLGTDGIVFDITERKAAEAERDKLKSQLQQAQKMEAVGTLAGGIAHDFNNILSSIMGYSELSLLDINDPVQLEENLNEVIKAGSRAKNLIKQVLTFARHSDEKISPCRMDRVAEEVIAFMRSTIPATIEIQSHIKSRSLTMGNETQLHQVLMNLCTNASHAMEDQGGVLTIQIDDIVIGTGAELSIEELAPGDYVRVGVSDTGQGIPDEIINSIFDPYFTTKESGRGTGMGLALVHGIVESYQGKITVSSQLRKGTEFNVFLPVCNKKDTKEQDIEQTAAKGTETIMFVDDEPSIVSVNSNYLSKMGYTVETCSNGLQALELFKENPSHFDLVISDMTMPQMNGDKLAGELVKIKPDLPVIICTGFNKNISEEAVKRIGVKALIYKPFELNKLSKMIRQVLDDQ